MKQELSSLDIKYLADEIGYLKGARLQKFYQVDRFLIISVHSAGRGTQNIVLGNGMFHVTKYSIKKPEKPTNFAMVLRKYLKGARIEAVYQHGFERIVIIDTGEYLLIAELFSKGNIIFVSKADYRIWSVLERQLFSDTRKLKMHGTYAFPPASYNIKEIDAAQFGKLVACSEKQIVALLAREFSIGGTYAEDALSAAGIDKNTTGNKLTGEQVTRLHKTLKSFLCMEPAPEIVFQDSKMTDVSPFALKAYENNTKKKYASFNEAVDDFFTSGLVLEEEKKKTIGAEKKLNAYAVRIEAQKKAITDLEKKADALKSTGDMIYANYAAIDGILKKITSAGLKNAKGIPGVISFDTKQKTATIDVGTSVTLRADLSLNENANMYYTKSKKVREKLAGAKAALLESEKKLELYIEQKETKAEAPAKTARQEKKEWYEKFLWFFSSSGFLCVAGRDATSNEIVVKKHATEKDIIFHADISGSPFGVLKTEGREVDRKTLEEAAQFIASYSRAWRSGVGVLEAYWVLPGQVTKKTQSGEFMGKGSFMVYGKKNIIKTELRLAVGFDNDRIVAGPVGAVSSRTKKFVTIIPGDVPAGELSKKIKARLFGILSKQEQEVLKTIGIDNIQRHIPAGKGDVAG